MTGLNERKKRDSIVRVLAEDEESLRAAVLIGDYTLAAKAENAERFLREMKTAMELVRKEYHFQLNEGKIYPCRDFKFKEPHFLKYVVTKRDEKTNKYEPLRLISEGLEMADARKRAEFIEEYIKSIRGFLESYLKKEKLR